MLKCNLTSEEKAEAWALFPPYIATRDLEAAREKFKKYIFYDTWGRRNFREYYCPECGRFEVEGGKAADIYCDSPFDDHHGDSVECPLCGTAGTLICLGRMRSMNSLMQEEKMLFFQAREGKLLLRAGWLRRRFDREDLNPLPEFMETARYYVAPGKRQAWKRGVYGAYVTGDGWEEKKSFTEPFPRDHYFGYSLKSGRVYAIGMERIEETDMRHCMLEEYLMDAFLIDGLDMTEPVRGMVAYLGEYTRRPQMEMLVKLGHHDVITALLEGDSLQGLVDWRAKRPDRFFRLTKPEYKAFREAGGKIKDLEAWRKSAADMSFVEFAGLVKIFGRNTSAFLARFGGDGRRKKLCRWYEKQKEALKDKTWTWWMDTLHSEKLLGNNVTHDHILMPEDLEKRHDEAAALVVKLEQEREEELVKSYGSKRFKALKKRYAWTDGTLLVKVPTCAEEIENEGRALRHCVAGYAERHIKGKTTILFLRWADDPDTPYITIEMNEAEIRQIHGYGNERAGTGAMSPRAIHGEMLETWQEWLRRGSPRTSTGKPVRIRKEEVKTA